MCCRRQRCALGIAPRSHPALAHRYPSLHASRWHPMIPLVHRVCATGAPRCTARSGRVYRRYSLNNVRITWHFLNLYSITVTVRAESPNRLKLLGGLARTRSLGGSTLGAPRTFQASDSSTAAHHQAQTTTDTRRAGGMRARVVVAVTNHSCNVRVCGAVLTLKPTRTI